MSTPSRILIPPAVHSGVKFLTLLVYNWQHLRWDLVHDKSAIGVSFLLPEVPAIIALLSGAGYMLWTHFREDIQERPGLWPSQIDAFML